MGMVFRLGIGILVPAFADVGEIAARIKAEVATPFRIGSGDDILLRPYVSAIAFGDAYHGHVGDEALHDALARLNTEASNGGKEAAIGILLAHSYSERDDFFGLMFDQDYAPNSSNQNKWKAREGCAIFLEGIRQRRQNKEDLLVECVYTAIHELGHVFNQQHSAPHSFMATSADEAAPFQIASCAFNAYERGLLAQCSSSQYIQPGGYAFGDLGTLGAGHTHPPADNGPALPQLRIRMDRSEFWQFEPVELDISAFPGAERKLLALPDQIDPGFSDFVIWIEQPNGERRRYRPNKHFCGTQTSVIPTNARGEFHRDLGIFAESGCFTFRQAGRHRIHASLKIAGGSCIESNRIEVVVLPAELGNAFFGAARKALVDHELSRMMIHRTLNRNRLKKLHLLQDLCDARPEHPTTSAIQYALGRAFADHAEKARALGRPVAELRRKAKASLDAAIGRPDLSDHRRARAQTILSDLLAIRSNRRSQERQVSPASPKRRPARRPALRPD